MINEKHNKCINQMVITLVYPWGPVGWCTSLYEPISETLDYTRFCELGGQFQIGIGGKIVRNNSTLKHTTTLQDAGVKHGDVLYGSMPEKVFFFM